MFPDMVSSPLGFQRKILEGVRKLQNAQGTKSHVFMRDLRFAHLEVFT
jgi:hypothetical protein